MSGKSKSARPRNGFSKIPTIKEWSLEEGIVTWKENPATSIKFASLPFSLPDPVNPPNAQEKQWLQSFKQKMHRHHSLKLSERIELMADAYRFSPASYLNVLRKILGSSEWSDTEKLYLLIYKLPALNGNKDGANIEGALSKLQWKTKSFKERMDNFYNTIRKHGIKKENYERRLILDEKQIQLFQRKIFLFRGFIVPVDQSIRDKQTERWFKQVTGKSVYFSTDIRTARYFAAINKYNAFGMIHGLSKSDMTKEQKNNLEGKLAVAKYEVDIDDIILYDDFLGRCESECICLPEKVKLINYEFLGFDNFISELKERHPSRSKLKLLG